MIKREIADHELRVVSLSIWKQLYATVWLAFLQIVLAIVNIPGFRAYLL
jgi:hypothetical protein